MAHLHRSVSFFLPFSNFWKLLGKSIGNGGGRGSLSLSVDFQNRSEFKKRIENAPPPTTATHSRRKCCLQLEREPGVSETLVNIVFEFVKH